MGLKWVDHVECLDNVELNTSIMTMIRISSELNKVSTYLVCDAY